MQIRTNSTLYIEGCFFWNEIVHPKTEKSMSWNERKKGEKKILIKHKDNNEIMMKTIFHYKLFSTFWRFIDSAFGQTTKRSDPPVHVYLCVHIYTCIHFVSTHSYRWFRFVVIYTLSHSNFVLCIPSHRIFLLEGSGKEAKY